MKTFCLILALVLAVPCSALAERNASIPVRQPAKIIQTVQVNFPSGLSGMGYWEGEAKIVVNIDSNGKLVDWLVIEYTHRLFADEAVWALKQWEYEPARLQGKAVSTRFELRVNFELTKAVISYDAGTSLGLYATRFLRTRAAYGLCSLKELDRIPIPLKTVKPAYSESLAKQGVQGAVTVDFFIDEMGSIRMPAIVTTDGDELSSLAMDALLQWKFEPPTRKEQPVLVKAKQVFTFGPKKS